MPACAACKREPRIKTCAYVGAGGRGRAREGGVHVCYLLCGFGCVGQDVDAPVGMYLPYANTQTATRPREARIRALRRRWWPAVQLGLTPTLFSWAVCCCSGH